MGFNSAFKGLNSVSIVTNGMCTIMNKSNVKAFVNNLFTFLSLLSMSNFFSILIVFYWFFFNLAWTRWCRFTFLTHVCKKIHCCWRGNGMSHVLLSRTYQSIDVTNQKLSRKFRKWCKCLGCVKAKPCSKKLHKMTPVYVFLSVYVLVCYREIWNQMKMTAMMRSVVWRNHARSITLAS